MNIVLFGPPGAGKGTQADKLVKDFNLFKVSTGDLLRNEIDNKSELGLKIKSEIEKGMFVSDDIINNLIEKILIKNDLFNRLIFDGYPRNITQAKSLDLLMEKNSQHISCVLCLVVDRDSITKRILGRQVCSKCGLTFNIYFHPSTKENHSCDSKFLLKRSDDNEKTIIKRFETYSNKTLPILDFYSEKRLLHQINGMREIDQIYQEIQGIITSLET